MELDIGNFIVNQEDQQGVKKARINFDKEQIDKDIAIAQKFMEMQCILAPAPGASPLTKTPNK